MYTIDYDKKDRKYTDIGEQILLIIGIFIIFLLSVSYRQFVSRNEGIVLLISSIILLIAILGYYVKKVVSNYRINPTSSIIEFVIFLTVFITRVPLFQYIQKYDGGIYWGAVYKCARDFELSFEYIWQNFKIWGHPSIMFTFFSIIGEFFTFGNSTGYCIVITIMSCFAIICIYRICVRFLEVGPQLALLLCMTLQFVPLFWGTFSHVNPDFYLFLFFIFMWYTHINKKYLLCFFWMFCMIQTKETSYFLLFGYSLFYVVWYLASLNLPIAERLLQLLKNPFTIVCFINSVIQGFIFAIQGNVLTWQLQDRETHKWIVGYNDVLEYGTDVNAFGLYPKYIVCKLIHLFFTNYNWVATVCILLSVVILYKRRFAEEYNLRVLVPLCGTMASFVLFSMTYITFALYRYNILFVVMYWFICLLLLEKVIQKKRYLFMCYLGIAVLLSIQTFYNTDYLSDYIFNKYPTGKGYLVATEMKKGMLGDNLVNNYKYTYTDYLIDNMLRTTGYNEDMVAVYSDDDYINRLDIMALDTINGEHLYAGWNKSKNRRVVYEDYDAESIKIKTIPYSEMLTTPKANNQKYLLYYFDYCNLNNEDINKDIDGKFKIDAEATIENWGGEMHYMLLSKE